MAEGSALLVRILIIVCCLSLPGLKAEEFSNGPPASSLCSSAEQVIFSCALRKPLKIVSLCASRDLATTKGYLQYRFGVPGNVELEFPRELQSTQKVFKYEHYFRAQVDNTSISFSSSGYDYSIFDEYNGEEKPRQSQQGVRVTTPAEGHDVTFVCKERATANYSQLSDILPQDPQ